MICNIFSEKYIKANLITIVDVRNIIQNDKGIIKFCMIENVIGKLTTYHIVKYIQKSPLKTKQTKNLIPRSLKNRSYTQLH